MAYIGIDLHSDNFRVCRLGKSGRAQYQTFQLEETDLTKFTDSLSSEDELAVEMTGNTSWFCSHVSSIVNRIVAVNARDFKVITQSAKKTDSNDAHALALFLSKGILQGARIKTPAQDDIATLVRGRHLLVKQRVALNNAIHGQFIRHGFRLGPDRLSSLKRLRELDLTIFSMTKQQLLMIMRDQMIRLNQDINLLERQIVAIASELDGYEGLISISGIGGLSAAIFLAEIGNVRDFSTPNKLASYFGVVPRVNQSNETKIYGRITKRGNNIARTTLIQCTWITIRYSDYLKTNYDRIRATRGSQKAIVATSRKLLRVIYDTLLNGWVFEDFPKYQLRQ